MKSSQLEFSRRSFLQKLGLLAAGVAISPALLDAVERLAPRRLYTPGMTTHTVVLDQWHEVKFMLTDDELLSTLRWEDGGFTGMKILDPVEMERLAVPGTDLGDALRCMKVAIDDVVDTCYIKGTVQPKRWQTYQSPGGGNP